MGGFFSMEQNARRNNGPNLEKGEGGYGPRTNNVRLTGANAPRVNNNQRSVNLEAGLNSTRRNNGNNRRNNSRRNSVASDPRELEEVVVTEPPTPPPNTVVNVNRPAANNGRITVVATNEQAPLPPNTTPEGEEQVGGKRKRSRRSKRSRRGKSKRVNRAA